MEKCFAMKRDRCPALVGTCPGYDKCPFYKTHKDFEEGQKAALSHIATLPVEEQRYYAERYYDKKMPWASESE